MSSSTSRVSSAWTAGTAGTAAAGAGTEALGGGAGVNPWPQATPRASEQLNSKIDVLTDVYLALSGKRVTG